MGRAGKVHADAKYGTVLGRHRLATSTVRQRTESGVKPGKG